MLKGVERDGLNWCLFLQQYEPQLCHPPIPPPTPPPPLSNLLCAWKRPAECNDTRWHAAVFERTPFCVFRDGYQMDLLYLLRLREILNTYWMCALTAAYGQYWVALFLPSTEFKHLFHCIIYVWHWIAVCLYTVHVCISAWRSLAATFMQGFLVYPCIHFPQETAYALWLILLYGSFSGLAVCLSMRFSLCACGSTCTLTVKVRVSSSVKSLMRTTCTADTCHFGFFISLPYM